MGFLDKAKAAADQLAAKADTAMANAGLSGPGTENPDRWFHDLGVLAYLDATGRPGSAEERERVMAGLRDLEGRGLVRSFALQTAAPAPAVPPPPGQAAAQAAQAAQGPAAPAAAPPPPPQPQSAPPPPPPQSAPPPPPPPSWMKPGEDA